MNRFDVAEHAASEEDYKEQKRNLLSCVGNIHMCRLGGQQRGKREKGLRDRESRRSGVHFEIKGKGGMRERERDAVLRQIILLLRVGKGTRGAGQTQSVATVARKWNRIKHERNFTLRELKIQSHATRLLSDRFLLPTKCKT